MSFVSRLLPVSIVVMSLVCAGIVVAYADHVAFSSHNNSASSSVSCGHIGTTHEVRISAGTVLPQHTSARLCDRLTITNEDNELRLIAFGLHAHHQAYDGTTERTLAPSQDLSVVLNQAGNFTFHDHLNDTVVGTFTVTR